MILNRYLYVVAIDGCEPVYLIHSISSKF